MSSKDLPRLPRRGRGKQRRRMRSREWQIKGLRDNTNINFVGKIKNVA